MDEPSEFWGLVRSLLISKVARDSSVCGKSPFFALFGSFFVGEVRVVDEFDLMAFTLHPTTEVFECCRKVDLIVDS